MGRAASRSEGSILVADDEYAFARAIAVVLEREGYTTHVVANGAQALAKLRDGLRVDVLVTDDEMPELDGLALVRTLRDDAELASIPVILLASRGRSLDGIPATVVSVLYKPFAAADLLLDVQAIFGGLATLPRR